ncbi:hypothetical protein GGI12_002481 [Dipsacomyces acuminosporus]|nr:hypothetical protein GGI12_002481 [Dipsacomyces acuminosporus]
MACDRTSIGIEPSQPVFDIDSFVEHAVQAGGADFVVVPVTHPQDMESSTALKRGHFSPCDLVVTSPANAYRIIGKTRSWSGCSDGSPDLHEAMAKMELEYAAYIGIRGVIAPPLGAASSIYEYARLLLSLTTSSVNAAPVIVRVGISASGSGMCNGERHGSWALWNKLRLLCDHDTRLQLALELNVGADEDIDISQWIAEPVQLLILPTRMFTRNAAGYPVLPKKHQKSVKKWMEFSVALVVSAQPGDQTDTGDHVKYLRHLAAALSDRDPDTTASDEYNDVLQAPLQPLMDHLESATYEVFEQDLPKYGMYEEAMFQAINDCTLRAQSKGDGAPRNIALIVAGAGRGPLVSRAISAARRSGARVSLYALEKNPSAFVELQRKNATLWNSAVNLVHADMRQWKPSRKADILVSELLGSFGDNELSPECLDGAQRMLLAEDGVCIPQEYTAYVAPMSSSVLHNKAKAHSAGYQLETPYVVHMHAVDVLAGPLAVWSFHHPNGDADEPTSKDSNSHNQRSSSLSFEMTAPSLLHGLAGYFDAKLYGSVRLSIHPSMHTPNMHSWFPIYFPIKRPMSAMAGDRVVVNMWRCTDSTKTWYEWSISTPADTSAIHNINGHEYWIGQ